MAITEQQPWSLRMALATPVGQTIKFFRAVGPRTNRHKVFFAGQHKIFILRFNKNNECIDFVERARAPHESLLGIVGTIEEQLREANQL